VVAEVVRIQGQMEQVVVQVEVLGMVIQRVLAQLDKVMLVALMQVHPQVQHMVVEAEVELVRQVQQEQQVLVGMVVQD
jgi:hypothetical protein